MKKNNLRQILFVLFVLFGFICLVIGTLLASTNKHLTIQILAGILISFGFFVIASDGQDLLDKLFLGNYSEERPNES